MYYLWLGLGFHGSFKLRPFFAFLEVTFKKVPDKATSTNRPKDKLTEKPATLTPSKSVLASPTPKLSSRHYRQDKTNGKKHSPSQQDALPTQDFHEKTFHLSEYAISSS